MPFFSVIIPAFNSAPFLNNCVDSILNQSFSDYEIIIVDDGSADETWSVCRHYAQTHSNIFVYHQENRGVTAARKNGLTHATGQYVCYIDSDDTVQSDYLEHFSVILKDNPVDIVCFGYTILNENHISLSTATNSCANGIYSKEALSELRNTYLYNFRLNYINMGAILLSSCVKVFLREFLLPLQLCIPDSFTYGEDMTLVGLAISSCHSLFVDSYDGYQYIQRETSCVHTFCPDRILDVEKLDSFLLEHSRIPEENIFACDYRIILEQLSAAALSLKCRDFRHFAQNVLKDAFIRKRVDSFSHTGIIKNEKIKSYLLKHRGWRLYWILLNRRRIIGRPKL